MSNKEGILRFLGLCMRAGKVVSGFDLVADAIRKNKVELLIIAEDISSNTLGKLLDTIEGCKDAQIEAYRFGSSYDLGNAIGKPNRAVVAVCDKGFAAKFSVMFSELVDSEEND